MIKNVLIAPIHFISTSVLYLWRNAPTFWECFIFSGIQSFFETIFNTDKSFGNNPTSKSIIRDVAKAPGEIPLAQSHNFYGGTNYWHDDFSLLSSFQKPVVKGSVIGLYTLYYQPDVPLYIDKLEDFIKRNKDISLEIPKQIQVLLDEYLSEGILGTGGRLSNFIGEPLSRIIDKCSKVYQDNIYDNFIQKLMKDQDIAKNAAESLFASNPQIRQDMLNFISTQSLSFTGALSYVLKNGLKAIPYAGAHAVLKTAFVDLLGEYYGKINIKYYFKSVREFVENKAMHHIVGDIDHSNDSSLFSENDLAYVSKIFMSGTSFTMEWTEKTLYNMLTMLFLSTPNKAIGNLLHYTDSMGPVVQNIFWPTGMAAGAYYVKAEFFDDKLKNTRFSEFVEKKKDLHLDRQEQCFVGFFDKMLSAANNSLTIDYDNINYEVAGLLGCLDSVLVEA